MSSILIVDDEPGFREMLTEHLAMEGYQVHSADSGEAGIERMRAQPPDLVLLDVNLPGMDGYEVCSHMQADSELSHVPVIMLTARTRTGDLVSAYETGVDDFVTKPFDVDELLIRIRAQLSHLYHEQVSDLTGLPGSEAVEEQLARRRLAPERWCVLHAGISSLRVYNEAYSFTDGDNLIRLASDALRDAIELCDDRDAFLGHLGGSSFVAIVSGERVDCVGARAAAYFDEHVQQHYTQTDRSRGYVVALDRDGRAKQWPLARLELQTARQLDEVTRV